MQHRYWILTIAAVAASDAHADTGTKPLPHWYWGLNGDVTFLRDVANNESLSVFGNFKEGYHVGYGFSTDVGYRFDPYSRLELEMGTRQNKLDTINGVPYTPSSGHFSVNSTHYFMTNAFYDFRNSSNFTPYLGAGIGATRISNSAYATISGEYHRLREWVLGYQFMAGVSYRVPESNVEFLLGYRYVTSQDGETSWSTLPGYKRTFDSTSHNIEGGFRYNFGS